MYRTWLGRLVCIGALVVSALAIPYAASLAAPKSAEAEAKARGTRLPNFYAKVSTAEQEPKLRAVMEEFGPQIQKMRDELAALLAKRDAALDQVLTPEQRQTIAKLREEAGSTASAEKGKKAKLKSKAKKAA